VERSGGSREMRRQFLEAIYDLAGGTPYQYVYWQNVAPRLGWDAENPDHLEQAIGIAQYLADSKLIKIMVDEGTIYTITTAGIDEVEKEEAQGTSATPSNTTDESDDVARLEEAPLHIRDSLQRFKADYPDPAAVAFILMQFRDTKPHQEIVQAIKDGLAEHDITGVRADDKEYHDDLFPNVLTYMHGCGMGVAVFEHIEAKSFNPNVALELGYMYAMRKPLCLLKDQNLTALHSDLMGKLYREFDSYDPAGTIPPRLSQWLTDKALSKR
jgi:nucleoside 2-deoxyribosyltransferase